MTLVAGVRASVRLALMALATLPLYAAYLCLKLAAPLWRSRSRRGQGRILRAWARCLAHLLCMRVHRLGRPPEAPFLLVSNHLSYVDIVAYWTVLEAHFLSKAEVASWPLLGRLSRSVGTLFIDRARRSDVARVVAEIEQCLARGESVLFFPEATSSSGEDVLPFRAGVFEVAVRGGIPVHCAAVRYRAPEGFPPARESVCWWGDMAFAGHFWRLLGLPGFDCDIEFEDRAVAATDRKELARRAEDAVRELYRHPAAKRVPA